MKYNEVQFVLIEIMEEYKFESFLRHIDKALEFDGWSNPMFCLQFVMSCMMGLVLNFAVVLCTQEIVNQPKFDNFFAAFCDNSKVQYFSDHNRRRLPEKHQHRVLWHALLS